MVSWLKRAKRIDTEHAEKRVWRSRCGRYKVEENEIRYGRRWSNGVYLGFPKIYITLCLTPTGWRILSRHRKRRPAIRALEYYAKYGTLKKKKKKRKRKRK